MAKISVENVTSEGQEDLRCNNRPSAPPPPSHSSIPLIKKPQITQLFTAAALLTRCLAAPASYSNPRLLPARNSTVRNLSARRLKPEECYCSGHSCTSSGPATVGGGVEGKGGRSRRCEKGNFMCFQSSAVSRQRRTYS